MRTVLGARRGKPARTAAARSPGAVVTRWSAGGIRLGDHLPRWEAPAGRAAGHLRCRLRVALGRAYRRHGPGRKARGHAERRRSGPVPSRPSPSGPHHWRADLWSLPWTRIGQTPCGSVCVEVTSFGVDPPVTGRSPLRSEAGSPDHEQAKEAADVGGELRLGPTRRAPVCGHVRVRACARVPAGRPAWCPPASAAEGAAPLAAHDPGSSHAGARRRCPLLPVVQGVDAAAGGLPAVGHEQTRHRPSVAVRLARR